MLTPPRKPKPPAAARTLTMPAPTGGLNARDALAAMPATDAVTLDNFFPGTTSVDLRSGYEQWSTGYPAAVESLMTYNGPSASKMFAASGSSIYDATTKGAVGAPVVTGLSNARWQYVNMGTPGGQFVVAVNGSDAPYSYNGTAWLRYASVDAQPLWRLTADGTTVTAQTSAPHGLITGDTVTIVGATPAGYNGQSQVTVPSEVPAQTIATITFSTTTATLTTIAPHGLVTGALVVVTGAVPAQYNGNFQITVTGANTFTYTMVSAPASNATTVGTYTSPVNSFTLPNAAAPAGSASVVGSYVVAPAITGVDPKKLIHVNVYASRLFFVEKDSCRFWYLPVNTVSGAASSFDLAPLFTLGGYLMAMATWTIDNAAGMVEYAVFISSEGEVVVYSGSDPSSASAWVKAGRFRLGRPVGRRCYERMGSDVVLISRDGFLPLSRSLLTDRAQMQDAISNKIEILVSNDVSRYGDNFGWQATLHPRGQKMIVNVPQTTGKQQYQYVMNTITGAWCRFTNWNANTFELMGDDLFFGSNLQNSPNSAFVARCDVGNSDNGAFIFGEVKTAFHYFGSLGYQKQVLMARPLLQTSGDLTIAIGMDMDFSDSFPEGMPTFSGVSGTKWNVAKWNTFPWGSDSEIKRDWQSVTGVGDAAAFHMRVANNKTALQWQAVQYTYRLGGIL